MRIKVAGGRLICYECGADFPVHGTKYSDICDFCHVPHKSFGWAGDVYGHYSVLIWPAIVAMFKNELKNSYPKLTLKDMADVNPVLKVVFEEVGDRYKGIVIT